MEFTRTWDEYMQEYENAALLSIEKMKVIIGTLGIIILVVRLFCKGMGVWFLKYEANFFK